jgi:hypothetical protein
VAGDGGGKMDDGMCSSKIGVKHLVLFVSIIHPYDGQI